MGEFTPAMCGVMMLLTGGDDVEHCLVEASLVCCIRRVWQALLCAACFCQFAGYGFAITQSCCHWLCVFCPLLTIETLTSYAIRRMHHVSGSPCCLCNLGLLRVRISVFYFFRVLHGLFLIILRHIRRAGLSLFHSVVYGDQCLLVEINAFSVPIPFPLSVSRLNS